MYSFLEKENIFIMKKIEAKTKMKYIYNVRIFIERVHQATNVKFNSYFI
jgi:hypothetical protein